MTSVPKLLEIFAISSPSVETIILVIYLEPLAALML